jgi:hypothetical protein
MPPKDAKQGKTKEQEAEEEAARSKLFAEEESNIKKIAVDELLTELIHSAEDIMYNNYIVSNELHSSHTRERVAHQTMIVVF